MPRGYGDTHPIANPASTLSFRTQLLGDRVRVPAVSAVSEAGFELGDASAGFFEIGGALLGELLERTEAGELALERLDALVRSA